MSSTGVPLTASATRNNPSERVRGTNTTTTWSGGVFDRMLAVERAEVVGGVEVVDGVEADGGVEVDRGGRGGILVKVTVDGSGWRGIGVGTVGSDPARGQTR